MVSDHYVKIVGIFREKTKISPNRTRFSSLFIPLPHKPLYLYIFIVVAMLFIGVATLPGSLLPLRSRAKRAGAL